ncbi:MAG: pyridoxal phosphate-dependent aminotransferase [Candidatus Micrarchaeota archaeon]
MVGFYELAEKALLMENAGKKVIRLNVGDTNLPTPQCAIDAAIARIKSDKVGYGPAAGLPELRKKIAERENCDISNVVVGSGSKILLHGLLTILGKKSVIVNAPYWPAYRLICNQLNLKIKENNTKIEKKWELSIPKFNSEDVMILCNPNNPTSTNYDERIVNETIENAEKNNATVILDEAYKGLSFKKMPQYENAIRIRSFSKEFNMEGWRLGYVVASKEIATKLTAFNQISTTCTPAFIQKAGFACLENEKEILSANTKIWMERSLATQSSLKKAKFEFTKPDAGIYIFTTHPDIDEKFVMKLLENEVVVAPGNEFGENYKKFVRICINQPEEIMSHAIRMMEKTLVS